MHKPRPLSGEMTLQLFVSVCLTRQGDTGEDGLRGEKGDQVRRLAAGATGRRSRGNRFSARCS